MKFNRIILVLLPVLFFMFVFCGSSEVKKVEDKNQITALDIETSINGVKEVTHKIGTTGEKITLEIKGTVPCQLELLPPTVDASPDWLKLDPTTQSMQGTLFKFSGIAKKGKYKMVLAAYQLDDKNIRRTKSITFDIK